MTIPDKRKDFGLSRIQLDYWHKFIHFMLFFYTYIVNCVLWISTSGFSILRITPVTYVSYLLRLFSDINFSILCVFNCVLWILTCGFSVFRIPLLMYLIAKCCLVS